MCKVFCAVLVVAVAANLFKPHPRFVLCAYSFAPPTTGTNKSTLPVNEHYEHDGFSVLSFSVPSFKWPISLLSQTIVQVDDETTVRAISQWGNFIFVLTSHSMLIGTYDARVFNRLGLYDLKVLCTLDSWSSSVNTDLVYDPIESVLIYSHDHYIRAVPLNSLQMTTLAHRAQTILHLKTDLVHKKLVWIESKHSGHFRVLVASMDGVYLEPVYESDKGPVPSAMALDPSTMSMYWIANRTLYRTRYTTPYDTVDVIFNHPELMSQHMIFVNGSVCCLSLDNSVLMVVHLDGVQVSFQSFQLESTDVTLSGVLFHDAAWNHSNVIRNFIPALLVDHTDGDRIDSRSPAKFV